jgi:hypothetical protein
VYAGNACETQINESAATKATTNKPVENHRWKGG